MFTSSLPGAHVVQLSCMHKCGLSHVVLVNWYQPPANILMDNCTQEQLTLTSIDRIVLLVCRLVQVLLCSDSPPSDTLKMYCWSDPTPRTACYNPNPAACKYSYTWAVTPVVTAIQPIVGAPGDVLTLQGNAFDDVSAVLLTDRWGAISCPIDSKYSTNITCDIPDMPAGQYVVSTSYS